MRLPFLHPSLSQLSAFVAGEQSASDRARTADHVAQCTRCQDAVRFVHRVSAPQHEVVAPADDALLARIQASRAAGVRTLVPAPARHDVRTLAPAPFAQTPFARSWRRVGAWAAAAMVLVAVSRLFAPAEAVAADSQGTLTLSPALPRPGGTVRVRYVPASNVFVGLSTVRVRARLRTPDNESYTVPPSHLRTLTTLSRTRDGAFEGRFDVPDSVVFAALAVESLDSATVDDNAGQGWELMVSARDTIPMFASLYQRSEDMMGRSWEEGYASAQRLTELYPDSVLGWTKREFFERTLFSGRAGDSVAALRAATINAVAARAMQAPRLSYWDIEALYYRAYSAANRPGATAQDSVTWDAWWARLVREYPRHEQVVQRHAVWMDVKRLGAARALDSLETLYALFAPLRTPAGRNLVSSAEYVAAQLGDDVAKRRWMARSLVGIPDSARAMAAYLASVPAFRDEGMQQLRGLLRDPGVSRMVVRPLSRHAANQQRAVDDLRRSMYSALGRALVASGKAREALDTLRLASEGAWDPTSFNGLARSYLLAGDTVSAMRMRARQVVDGRTSVTTRDSLQRVGAARLGAASWESMVREARQEMHTRLLERSIVRGVAPSARAQSRDGVDRTLRELTGEKASVVIFWSRHCGYALDALPSIRTLVARLRDAGTPVVFVIDEAPSAELDAFLAERQITWPVYYDVGARMGNAMRNFGTPFYYVLDAAQRIRFSPNVDDLGDVYGRVEALTAGTR